MLTIEIQPFSQYILRTPAFPLSTYLKLLEDYSPEALLLQFDDLYIREAIRIASPELLTALDKWKANPSSLSNEKRNGLEITLLKYIARMSSRCTPFGLFAGCNVGNIASETNISLESIENFQRFTQFDMHFWVAMLQEFSKRKEVIDHLIYFPNNSIYILGDFYRYVEYKYVRTKREHSISALRKSTLLAELLLKAKSGITVDEMVCLLADETSEIADALDFIYQLIDFQFLVSELDATVTGSDEWERVFTILNKIPALKNEAGLLQTIKEMFRSLDINVTPPEHLYETIKLSIHKTGLPYDEKYLFQTDLNIATSSNNLNTQVPKKVMQALNFLNGIQQKKELANHANFIKNFNKRYATREMPLVTILDTETGIGYLQNSEMNDTHDILEAFSFKKKTESDVHQSWTVYDFILEKKVQECILKKETIISLSEKDFADFDSDWKIAPATFSVMIEIVKNLENELISIESSGNISAAKLLGRFCNGNTAINNLTNQIVEKEKNYHPDKILAEIAHIPESRTGNILRRPVLREHEIPYLSNSGVTQGYNIELNDLMVSIKKDKIVLRSRKHDKEVIPCLSNAHNYSENALPIYQFLCDLQSQGIKPIYSFSWGILDAHYSFLPRVIYKDVILSKAKWIVTKKEIDPFFKQANKKLFEDFTIWRMDRNIPQFANWICFDNTLLLDFEKEICIQLFLKSVKNNSKIILEEFLFTKESIVKNINGENFTNQFILSFYKKRLS